MEKAYEKSEKVLLTRELILEIFFAADVNSSIKKIANKNARKYKKANIQPDELEDFASTWVNEMTQKWLKKYRMVAPQHIARIMVKGIGFKLKEYAITRMPNFYIDDSDVKYSHLKHIMVTRKICANRKQKNARDLSHAEMTRLRDAWTKVMHKHGKMSVA